MPARAVVPGTHQATLKAGRSWFVFYNNFWTLMTCEQLNFSQLQHKSLFLVFCVPRRCQAFGAFSV